MPPATLDSEAVPGSAAFRHLSGIAGILVDLRYATPGNFVGRDLYSPLDCAWLHRDAAVALEQAVAWLAAHHPEHRLLVLDALRPQRVQQQLWDALQGSELLGYIAEPGRGSIHSFGMALDVTLVDADGRERDMGSAFDEFSERSQPSQEPALLACGAISGAQVANRAVLRAAMFQAGWQGIRSEWWHFDCGDRALVRQTYARVW
ncbi:M15 family metallopeptidase [Janthinobacterium fluminis]|uniref:D-alanyl-D-alanine dipeptidase n=1 Tax=Janthinobacterium fluminis TaxID=2987524 RepID=A0ABT5K0W5_9BURK|nr:M15 family metallopeptidase [Janthinobacterium fluminis]MDC8757946.1 M15 family metallopeptidase [Janthinobacterium fluminis]